MKNNRKYSLQGLFSRSSAQTQHTASPDKYQNFEDFDQPKPCETQPTFIQQENEVDLNDADIDLCTEKIFSAHLPQQQY